jgi:hypothetical protein
MLLPPAMCTPLRAYVTTTLITSKHHRGAGIDARCPAQLADRSGRRFERIEIGLNRYHLLERCKSNTGR